MFHQLKHRSHELTEVCRTGLPLRRHSCKCRNPGVAALKFVPQRHAIARADHLRVTLVVSPPLFPDPKLTHFQSAATFRMILTPVDTLKTTLQVQGARGTALLRQRIKSNGVGSLWWGAFATAAATFVGHYPWFSTMLRILPPMPSSRADCNSSTSSPKRSRSRHDTRSSYGCFVWLSSGSVLRLSLIQYRTR